MSVEDYQKAMAELGIDRAALDTGLPPDDLGSVTAMKEPAYVVPDGWKLSKVPLPPPDINDDLSALNGRGWKTAQKNGRRMGRPRKER